MEQRRIGGEDVWRRGAWLGAGLVLLSAAACQESREPTTTLTQAQWEEVKTNILSEAPADLPFKVGANYGGKIELIGLTVEPSTLKPGQEFTVTWWWRALAEVDVNWQVFVHLDMTGRAPTRQGLDHHPVRDLYQTTRWKPGQVIRDVQKVRLRNNYPGGEATFWVGLWNPATGKRLPLTNLDKIKHDNDNRVNAAVVKVDGAPPAEPAAAGDANKPKIYMARPRDGEIVIDGKLDDAGWQKAPRTARFGGTRGGPGPDGTTWAKLTWDEEALYVGLQGDDKDVWGELTERDSDTWTQEVFEVFIDPDGDAKDYLEIQVTPRNTVFDARFALKLGTGTGSVPEQINAARQWNSAMQTAVSVDGTLNTRGDEDRAWSAELRIPFTDIPGGAPAVGASWRMNLYRFDAPRDADGKPTGQVAWSWTPAHGSFHNVEHFGTVRFIGKTGFVGPGNLVPNLRTPEINVPTGPVVLPTSAASAQPPTSAPGEVEADLPP